MICQYPMHDHLLWQALAKMKEAESSGYVMERELSAPPEYSEQDPSPLKEYPAPCIEPSASASISSSHGLLDPLPSTSKHGLLPPPTYDETMKLTPKEGSDGQKLGPLPPIDRKKKTAQLEPLWRGSLDRLLCCYSCWLIKECESHRV